MIEQIKTFDSNALAITVINNFTEEDKKLLHIFFIEKIEKGFDKVNLLIELDEMKISVENFKHIFENIVWFLKNHKKNIGNLAIVAHSKIIKALATFDNLFFERLNKGEHERYFDVSQMDDAIRFVS